MVRNALRIFVHGPEEGAVKGGLLAFKISILASALGAINIGPIPIQWLGMAWILLVWFFLAHYTGRIAIKGNLLFLVFLGWATFVCVINLPNATAYSLPGGATTTYPVFIFLRYLTILSFYAMLVVTYWLVVRGEREAINRWVADLGVLVAAVSIYVYVAQLTGLPDIPRTRLGTSGEEQATVFTYAFHRAMGTFREPSHLAIWLVLPFFLSLALGRWIVNWRSCVIGIALLLTGSLTGLLSIVIGAVTAWIVLVAGTRNPMWLLKLPLRLAPLVLIALFGFYVIAQSYDFDAVDLWDVLVTRVLPILESGLEESNRDYVQEYVLTTEFPIVGIGPGNPNIEFARYLGLGVIASFMSLYVNVIYSLGMIGLALLVLFLLRPLSFNMRAVPAAQVWPVLASYIAWLVIHAITYEELYMMFGVTYALLASVVVKTRPGTERISVRSSPVQGASAS